MMTKKQCVEWLLELQEHSKQLTDEQLQQILADDEMYRLVQQLGFAKRAFKNQELQAIVPAVDDEWETFSASHAEELDALEKDKAHTDSQFSFSQLVLAFRFVKNSPFRKIAASFIGVLLATGIAFAAIHIVHRTLEPRISKPSITEVTKAITPKAVPTETIKVDVVPTEPRIFNNVPLDTMLTEIASTHGYAVEFQNEEARKLRFHFVWKHEDRLERIVEKLNTFEAVNIIVENEKLIVK